MMLVWKGFKLFIHAYNMQVFALSTFEFGLDWFCVSQAQGKYRTSKPNKKKNLRSHLNT